MTEGWATHPRRFRLAVGLVLVISAANALRRHQLGSAGAHGGLVTALLLVVAIACLAVPSPGLRWLRLSVAAAAAVALQLLTPTTTPTLPLYLVAGMTGSMVPRRWLAPPTIAAAAVALAAGLVRSPSAPLAALVPSVLSISAIVVLTNLLSDLRRSRNERERLFHELEAAYAELRRYAQQAEELAVLRERTRLARELHDTLGHALTTLTVQLEAIGRTARARPERLEPLLEDARALSRRAMQDLRESLADLREDAVDGPLTELLTALAESAAARNGWRLELALAPVELPPTTAHALLRIAREALANVERHAAAQAVTVSLSSQGDALQLAVRDDGSGFEPGAVPQDRYGLRGMRERAALHGAELSVRSAPRQGTEVRLRLPLAARGLAHAGAAP